MSTTQVESENAVSKVTKKEKREKKEKKRSKSKEEPVDDSAPADPQSAKKRKRDALPDEIEIDINLPEPASKKAARKAKKAKTQPTPAPDSTGRSDGTVNTEGETEAKEQAAKRSDYGVWIGNLPWSATKDSLRTFLAENAEIKPEEITRVHMPAPSKPPRPDWQSEKPQNKGFAYVDFSTQLAMYSAIALTETKMNGRALLIKNSKNFEGRPDKPKTEEDTGARKGKEERMPSRKIFVGNLAFETSKEDLETHFGQCGGVENIHMATFEDTGKSKGYAWVTFEDVDAATSAVKGFVYKAEGGSKKRKGGDDEELGDDDVQGKGKKRKYKLNKLMGRDLRCEFAEDSTTRYQKRFGKEKKQEDADGFVELDGDVHPQRQRPFARQDRQQRPFSRQDREQRPRGKIDPRTIRPGAAHTNAPRASAAIVASEGKKTTFD